MKRVFLILALAVASAFGQFGKSSGLSTMLSVVADSSKWIASGTTRITPKGGKAIYADSSIFKYVVIQYDSVRNTLKVGGLGGASVPLTVVGNKTTGDLADFINDKAGAVGDTTTRITNLGQIRIRNAAIGATADTLYGIKLSNLTAAAAGAQQVSPGILLQSYGWKTDATAGPQWTQWHIYNLPAQGTSAPSSSLYLDYKIGSGPWTNKYIIGSGSMAGPQFTASYFVGTSAAYYSTASDATFGGEDGVYFNIDYNNNDADTRYFEWGKNAIGSSHTPLMRLLETGKLGLGTTTPLNSFSLVDATSGQGTGIHVVSSQWNKARATWAAAHDTSSIMEYIDSAGGPRLSLKAVDGDSFGVHLDGSSVVLKSNASIQLAAGATSALATFSSAAFYFGDDAKSNGVSTARWQNYCGTDNIYLGGKSQTATLYVSGENTIAGQDSSWKMSAASGVPTLEAFHTGTFTNGGRRVYMGSDTLALFNGAKTGRDSTVYVMPDGSINSTATITSAFIALSSGGYVYTSSGDIGVAGEDNVFISMDRNNNDADTRYIAFGKNGSGSAHTELARLTEAGDSGWGTNSPGARMEVNGNKSADSVFIARNDRIGAPYDSAFVVLSTGGTRTTGMYGNNSEQAVTVATSATTFAVLKNNVAVTGDAGGNTVATITGGGAIGLYTFRFVDDKITITDTADGSANTVNLSAAFTSTANDIMTLYWNGTSWYEASRSVN